MSIYGQSEVLPAVCTEADGAANVHFASPRRRWGFGLTRVRAGRYTYLLMSATLPAVVDVWRMVSARRQFEGSLPLSAFARLRDSLLDAEGEVRYALEFGRDAGNQAFVEVRADAELPLLCQRTLERYLHRIRLVQQLGLVTSEAQESALPEHMEPLLVPESGELQPADLVEDELILALPVVPMNPDSTLPDAYRHEEEEDKQNPFGVLSALKDKQQ